MQQKLGTFLIVVGVLASMFYGYHYYEQLDQFEAFGTTVTLDSGDPVPLIISLVVVVIGVLVSRFNPK